MSKLYNAHFTCCLITNHLARCTSTRLKQGTEAQGQKKSPKFQSLFTGRAFPPVMLLVFAIRVNLRTDPDRIPDCTGERSLEKKCSAVTPAFLMGAERAASGQCCHGRLSMARRTRSLSLSLFSWKCVRVCTVALVTCTKGAIGGEARTSWDMRAKQTAGAARAQESSTICPPLWC